MGTDAKSQSVADWLKDYEGYSHGENDMSKTRWKDDGGGIDFEPPPAGLAVGRCYQIIDLGTHYNEMFGNYRRQVFIGFELPNDIKTWKDKEGNEQSGPFVIGGFFTRSLNEKANLRKFLEGWRGTGFTEAEALGFDPEVLVGVPGMINVVHEKREDGKVRAKIASMSRLMRGTECPKLVNEPIFFSFDDFSTAAFEKVPQGFQKMIMKSQEWSDRTKGVEDGKFVDDAIPGDLGRAEEDIPF